MDTKIRPEIIYTSESGWKQKISTLMESHPEVILIDYYKSQLKELHAVTNPEKASDDNHRKKYLTDLMGGKKFSDHGNWVYYPWRNALVKILPESEFQLVRTARNKPIISKEHQKSFAELHVGVVGLSVGNAIVQNLVYSGGCHKITLADPDTLDLSNLNRVQASVIHLGMNKAILTSQQIYEINPYAEVIIYDKRISVSNLRQFLTNPRLDLLIDECDDLMLKNYLRLSARALKIPFLSVTDVGLESKVDLLRFDKSSKVGGMGSLPEMYFDDIEESYRLTEPVSMSLRQQLKLIVELVGVNNISQEMQYGSMERVKKRIAGWPQLAMTVFMGGSLASFSAYMLATNRNVHRKQISLSLPSLLQSGYNSVKKIRQRSNYTVKFKEFIKKDASD